MTSSEIRAGAEMNRQIANNLALPATIIQIDSHAIRDPDTAFILEMTRRRIHAIARVHRHLERDCSDGIIDLRASLEALGADFQRCCEEDGGLRHLRVEADRVEMRADLAVSCGFSSPNLWGISASMLVRP